MATIRLTADVKALGGAQPGYDFETEDRERKTVYPYVAEGRLVWDIPDTSRNRSQIRAEFDSKKFAFELVHVEDIIPFKSPAAAPVASDLPPNEGNDQGDGGDGDGDDPESGEGLDGETGDLAGDPSEASTEDGSKKGQGKKGQGKKA